ncbi:MAG: hypothetical protein NVS3B24_23400 [Candidatus Dormibacteria bacterium]
MTQLCHIATVVSDMAPRRERQAELARATIIDALVSRLETGDEECSIDDVARDAQVSRRTLYRYFPSRADLYAAAADTLYTRMGQERPEVADASEITSSFIAGSKVTERHPLLSRALLRTPAGRGVRMAARSRRAASIQRALAEVGGALPPAAVKRRAAVVALLCSSEAFIALQDESGLTADESRDAIVTAIDVLLEDVRQRSGRNRAPASAGRETRK